MSVSRTHFCSKIYSPLILTLYSTLSSAVPLHPPRSAQKNSNNISWAELLMIGAPSVCYRLHFLISRIKLDMCLWNKDASVATKSKCGKNL